jgi:hypothetical protein
MSSETLAPAVPRPTLLPRPAVLALSIFAASAALCLLAYLAFAAHGPWFGGPSAMRWSASDLTVQRGTVRPGKDVVSILAPDESGTVVISLKTSFRATDYPVILWRATNVPAGVEAALLWYSDYRASRMSTRALTIEAGQIAQIDMTGDNDWIGNIRGLALVLRGPLLQPIALHGLIVKPMTPAQVLSDRLREWFAFEPWNGASINSVTGGADAQDLPLPIMLAAIALVGLLIYATLARLLPGIFGAFRPTVAAAIFLAAWLALDARWQWNLARQVRSTFERYAGKSWEERHLAAEDGPLFAFIEKAREKMPPPVVPAPRVFMVADLHYFRDRGAYHLYPYNVFFDPWQNTMPPASALKPGDFLIAYRRQGVQYDPGQQRLRWDGEAPVAAELILVEPGAAVFRIL